MAGTGEVLDPGSQQHCFTANDCTASLRSERNPLWTFESLNDTCLLSETLLKEKRGRTV